MKKKIISAFLIVLVLLLLLSCDLDTSREVKFYASSSSGFVSGNYYWIGGLNSFTDKPSPWSVEVETKKDDYVILTVLNTLGTGTVTAKIYVDGTLFREISGTDGDIIQVAGYID